MHLLLFYFSLSVIVLTAVAIMFFSCREKQMTKSAIVWTSIPLIMLFLLLIPIITAFLKQ